MIDISQMTVAKAFSWRKTFLFKFQLSMLQMGANLKNSTMVQAKAWRRPRQFTKSYMNYQASSCEYIEI